MSSPDSTPDPQSAPFDRPRAIAPRTPAQVAASKANGRKSNGPATPAGKRRSSQNACKHGLFARAILPPDDIREHRRLYKKFHKELLDEFKPRTFTGRTTVDQLAHDLVQSVRCKAIIEILQRPEELPANEMTQWRQFKLKTRESALVGLAIQTIKRGREMDLTLNSARRLATLVVQAVDAIEANAGEDEELDPLPDAEQAEQHALLDLIRPARRRLHDVDHLTAVMSGNAVPARGELSRLCRLLGIIQQWAAAPHREGRAADTKLRELNDQRLLAFAQDPARLLLLQRYQRQIESGIARKIAYLRK